MKSSKRISRDCNSGSGTPASERPKAAWGCHGQKIAVPTLRLAKYGAPGGSADLLTRLFHHRFGGHDVVVAVVNAHGDDVFAGIGFAARCLGRVLTQRRV